MGTGITLLLDQQFAIVEVSLSVALHSACLDTKKGLVASSGGMCGRGYDKCVHLSVSTCLDMLLENSRGQSVYLS